MGHAGTLDPMATGVLVVGVNKATRLLGHLILAEKEYLATIRIGASTVTDDREGEILSRADASGIDDDEIRAAVSVFVGDVLQIPSSVSAIKVGGQRSYARVRAGEKVALDPRPVQVRQFDVQRIRRDQSETDVDVRVVCSSGTYVRALARDVGSELGVGGHLISLRRTRVGKFTVTMAKTLSELSDSFEMLSLDAVAAQMFPTCVVDDRQAMDVRFGRSLASLNLEVNGPVALFSAAGEFLALYEHATIGAKPIAVFATLG